MPMTLGTIANRSKALAIPFDGDTINVTYRVGKITNAWKAQLLAAGDTTTDAQQDAFLDTSILELVASWDILTEVDGPVLPLTQATLDAFDLGVKFVLIRAIVQDATSGEALATPSAH